MIKALFIYYTIECSLCSTAYGSSISSNEIIDAAGLAVGCYQRAEGYDNPRNGEEAQASYHDDTQSFDQTRILQRRGSQF